MAASPDDVFGEPDVRFGGELWLNVGSVIVLLVVLFQLTKAILLGRVKERALAIAVLAFHAYIIPANFINSASLGRISFAVYWIVLGLTFSSMDSEPSAEVCADVQECQNLPLGRAGQNSKDFVPNGV